MTKKFTASILISTILSLLFLILAFNSIITQNKNVAEDYIFLLFFIIVYSFILVQNFICWRTQKRNQQKSILKKRFVFWGKIISIIAFSFGLILILCAIPGSFSFESYATKNELRFKLLFILTITFVIISGLAAIINCFYYFKAVKQNKAIVNSFINTIGSNSSV
jgi:hypothetical protein